MTAVVSRLENLEEDFARRQSEMNAIHLQEMETMTMHHVTETEMLRQERDGLEDQLRVLEEEVELLHGRLVEVSEGATAVSAVNVQLEQQNGVMEGNIVELKRDVEQLESNLKDALAQRVNLQTVLEHLEDEFERIKDAYTESQLLIQDMRAEIIELRLRNGNLTQQNRQSQYRQSQLQQQLREGEGEGEGSGQDQMMPSSSDISTVSAYSMYLERQQQHQSQGGRTSPSSSDGMASSTHSPHDSESDEQEHSSSPNDSFSSPSSPNTPPPLIPPTPVSPSPSFFSVVSSPSSPSTPVLSPASSPLPQFAKLHHHHQHQQSKGQGFQQVQAHQFAYHHHDLETEYRGVEEEGMGVGMPASVQGLEPGFAEGMVYGGKRKVSVASLVMEEVEL
ncbi:hypothetical protein HK102_006674 [Quaeritorhiza haematococci]|nr:hypothetical protein HK102_006674 [Quaeritorhiza haematococci]